MQGWETNELGMLEAVVIKMANIIQHVGTHGQGRDVHATLMAVRLVLADSPLLP